MTVRPLRPADEPAVRSMQRRLEYADPELVAAALEGPFLGLVVETGGDVAGYAIALPSRRTTLSELVVAPGHRGSGHGRALVEAVSAAGSGDALVVTTPVAEEEAQRFYEAIGFEVDERIAGFYGDGGDALRLVRRE